jgi:hypothetical protein
MALRFIGIDPGTDGDNCPAVFIDETSGDFRFQGEIVDDPAELAEAGAHSPIGDKEVVIKFPRRMAAILLEALDASKGTAVQ